MFHNWKTGINIKKRKKISLLLVLLFSALKPDCQSSILEVDYGFKVTSEFTDNLNQEDNKKSGYNNKYLLNLDINSITQKSATKIKIHPAYSDYSEDENDNFDQDYSLLTSINTGKRDVLDFSQSFSRSSDTSLRSGAWEKQDKISSEINFRKTCLKSNYLNIGIKFHADKYEDENADENYYIKPSIGAGFFFDNKAGLIFNFSHKNNKFKKPDKREETLSSSIKLLKDTGRHFNFYLSYNYSSTEENGKKHITGNPSFGFEWDSTETSTARVGLGVLFNDYEYQDDTSDLFFDIDLIKKISLSRKTNISLYGKSGFEETSEDAASLGFNITYSGGMVLTTRLSRKISLNLGGTIKNQRFEEKESNRRDNTLDIKTGVNIRPFKWLTADFSLSHTNFETDSKLRDDYQENKISITINLSPQTPKRIDTEPWETELTKIRTGK